MGKRNNNYKEKNKDSSTITIYALSSHRNSKKKIETIYFFLQLNLLILPLVLNFKITILATSKGSGTDVLAGQQCGSDILSESLLL